MQFSGVFTKNLNFKKYICYSLIFCTFFFIRPIAFAKATDHLSKLVGKQDAVIVADQNGRVLFSHNAKKILIPASTLKVFTSLAAFHYLGKDFRFITEFYLDKVNNLTIKGYGDPLLISEAVQEISATLADILRKKKGKEFQINHIFLDNAYFEPTSVPGSISSLEPYDSSNGALCVNFNTVAFYKSGGVFKSAEPQTPLLPFVLERITQSGLKKGRILLTRKQNEMTLYAGHLFRWFLKEEGITVKGRIAIKKGGQSKEEMIYTYSSLFPLTEVAAKLLEFSNNFIANQVFIACGAKAYGAPGKLSKGVRAAKAYAKEAFGIENIKIVEGSGISRENRISAENLLKFLNKFEPHYYLMRKDGNEYYKTGTLKGIRTRVGYIDEDGKLYRFVVLVNSNGKSTIKIMKNIHQLCKKVQKDIPR